MYLVDILSLYCTGRSLEFISSKVSIQFYKTVGYLSPAILYPMIYPVLHFYLNAFFIIILYIRFSEEYFREPNRGYGGTVINVFSQLRDEDYKDPHGPAKLSFEGHGSGGNGAAMRIAPLALYGYKMDTEQIIVGKNSLAQICLS